MGAENSRPPSRLYKASDYGLCQKKRLACVKAELDVSVIETIPFRKTISDELTDVFHNERFGGIRVEKPGVRVRHGLYAATLSPVSLYVKVVERNHSLKCS